MSHGVRPRCAPHGIRYQHRWVDQAHVRSALDLNGFAVVDFATHKEVRRIDLPKLGPGKKPVLTGGNASHGMAVTADGKRLVVDSRLNSAVYVYSLPDLMLLGGVDVGRSPDWVTLTPDSKFAQSPMQGRTTCRSWTSSLSKR